MSAVLKDNQIADIEQQRALILVPKISDEKGQSLLRQAQVIKIVDQVTYDAAAEIFDAACALEKSITGDFEDPKSNAYKTHKSICELEKKYLGPVLTAKNLSSRALGAWDDEQETLRRQEELRLEEEARKRADEEALTNAVEVEESGASEEEVEAVLSNPTPVRYVGAGALYEKKKATQEKWYGEVVGTPFASLQKLTEAAAKNPAAYLSCLLPNMSEINRRANNQKEAFDVPGFRARKENKAVNKPAGRGR